jgi:anaerobic magnesium-protoporphyrin IX monomethyl ester cyclase
MAGRLKGDVINPDYDFLDPRLIDYLDALNLAVSSWISSNGVSPHLNWAWHEVGIMERLFTGVTDPSDGQTVR